MKKRSTRYKKKRVLKASIAGIGILFLIAAAIFLVIKMNQPSKNKTKEKQTASSQTVSTPEKSKPIEETLSLEQEVGQLIMVGMSANAYNQTSMDAISKYQVGNVILTGRSSLDIASTKKITDTLQNLAPQNRKLLIATDQEGGYVQVLQGQGFSAIPDGVTQGTWSVQQLQASAQTWGKELANAGVNFDLAPVADLVTSEAFAPQNGPIGYYGREFGFDSETIQTHALAFMQGMKQANVLTTAKHFPSLGGVTGNTDTTAQVTDTQLNSDSASVKLFKNLIGQGVSSIMTATAIYTQIDPELPGAFSSKVVQGLLRDKLGFDGLVITDDLSDAAQVQAWTPGERAVLAINAGNDIVLANNPEQVSEMVTALIEKAQSDSNFAEKVHRASNRVLKTKSQFNLIKS